MVINLAEKEHITEILPSLLEEAIYKSTDTQSRPELIDAPYIA